MDGVERIPEELRTTDVDLIPSTFVCGTTGFSTTAPAPCTAVLRGDSRLREDTARWNFPPFRSSPSRFRGEEVGVDLRGLALGLRLGDTWRGEASFLRSDGTLYNNGDGE